MKALFASILLAFCVAADVSAAPKSWTFVVHDYSNRTVVQFDRCAIGFHNLIPGNDDASYLYAQCQAITPTIMPSDMNPIGDRHTLYDEIGFTWGSSGWFEGHGCNFLLQHVEDDEGVEVIECNWHDAIFAGGFE